MPPNYFTRAQSNPQLPNLPNPNFQYQDLTPTLDSLFNAYAQMKAGERADKLAGLQTQQIEGQIAAQDATQAAQFGAPLRTFGQQEMTQAATGQEAPFVLSPERVSVFNRLKEGLAKLGGRDPQTIAAQDAARQKEAVGLDLQRSQIAENNAQAAKAMREAGGNFGGLDPKARSTVEGQIMDDYMKSPTFVNLAAAKSGLRDLASIQSNKSGAADIAAIYSFIKTMDNNAVKEGEIQLAQSALPGLDRVKLIYDSLKAGNKITPQMKRELLEVGRGMYESKRKSADEFRTPFVSRAKQYGIDPEIAVPGLSIPDEEMRAMFGEPAPAGGPAIGTVRRGYKFLGGNPALPASWAKVTR